VIYEVFIAAKLKILISFIKKMHSSFVRGRHQCGGHSCLCLENRTWSHPRSAERTV